MRTVITLLSFVLCACALGGEPDAGDRAVTGAPPDREVVLERVESEEETFRVVRLLDGLEHAWAVDWLPDGDMLVTERPGRLLLVTSDTTTALSGVPEVWANGQGGLLDVRVHPDYAQNGWIYFSYSAPGEGGAGTVVSRARIDGDALVDVQELYRQFPFVSSGVHFGSRIAFHSDGTMFVTLGERGQRRTGDNIGAQDSTNTIGTTIRLNPDGSVPGDNPFVGRNDIPDEVYSYGHRNQQGMSLHPESGAVWQHEHGPHGGDELNLVQAGKNYGWPAVTYGDEYAPPHLEIGGTEAAGMTQPVEYWDPSPAFSGMTFYTGDKFPNWTNHLFMGALAHQKVLRVTLDGERVTHQEELLREELGRIRDVATGPDGYLYLLVDAADGGLYRLEPVE
jgi:glucose/arabinose dehydrogenase